MSRSPKSEGGKKGARRERVAAGLRRRSGRRLRVYVVGAVLVSALGLGVYASRANPGKHPEPRPGITAEHVMPASRYDRYPRIADVYRKAAQVPAALDGLYCYCECSRHAGHRSLLDCFESDHAAACDVCLSEAAMAHQMSRDRRSLDDIRDAIDHTFGS
ncbi:MAG: hypothetical protein HY704_04390 [Gemmatimonadetes bacterium]|nr:hypothetical protein [Gemmatimonadota bacterium]